MAGGSLSRLVRARLGTGARVVIKTDPLAEAEGEMLRAIARTGCAAPQVLATAPGLLAISELASGGPGDAAAWHAAGESIRHLHDATGRAYGWRHDHAFGSVSILNTPRSDWPGFWAEQRVLDAQVDVSVDLARRLEVLATRLPDLLPAAPPPSLLHGDLWSGNVLFGPDGFSGVIDPACYYGHSEVDLAMLTLFSTPDPAFWDAYGPVAEGWEARRTIYQLWPALVHLRLFGSSYRHMVEDLLIRAGV